jgi:hypothetical protein
LIVKIYIGYVQGLQDRILVCAAWSCAQALQETKEYIARGEYEDPQPTDNARVAALKIMDVADLPVRTTIEHCARFGHEQKRGVLTGSQPAKFKVQWDGDPTREIEPMVDPSVVEFL